MSEAEAEGPHLRNRGQNQTPCYYYNSNYNNKKLKNKQTEKKSCNLLLQFPGKINSLRHCYSRISSSSSSSQIHSHTIFSILHMDDHPPPPSSQLSLPPRTPTMSPPPPSSLSFDTRHVDRMINSAHYSSPSRTIYSDRFIPSRSASKFALFDIAAPVPASSPAAEGREDSSSAYTTLLRTALFGPDAAGVAAPVTPEKRSSPAGAMTLPSRNIFRYKTETRQSLHSLSPFMCDDAVPGVNHSPVKAPRKVPRSPYKVNFVFYWMLCFFFLRVCGDSEIFVVMCCGRFWMRLRCKTIFI